MTKRSCYFLCCLIGLSPLLPRSMGEELAIGQLDLPAQPPAPGMAAEPLHASEPHLLDTRAVPLHEEAEVLPNHGVGGTACHTCSSHGKMFGKHGLLDWLRSQTRATCAVRRPFGSCVGASFETQKLNGLVKQQILYHYDFHPAHSRRRGELTRQGRSRLERIADRMTMIGPPIAIQSTVDQAVNADRKESVLVQLAELGIEPTPETVVIVDSPIVGLGGRGERAAPRTQQFWSATYENRMQQTLNRGSRRLLRTLQF